MSDDVNQHDELMAAASALARSDAEVLPPTLADLPLDIAGLTPVAPQPLLPPLLRVVIYLPACVAGVIVGVVPTIIIAFVLIVAKHGSLPSGEMTSKMIKGETGIVLVSGTLGIYPILVGITCLFVTFVDRRPLASIGLTKQRWLRDLAVGWLLGAGFIIVATLLEVCAGWVRLQPATASLGLWALATITVFPLIGLSEEVVFRGYLMKTLDEWRGRRVAIAVTSVLFWSMHLGQGNIHQPLGIATMVATAVMFALCRYGAGSLWMPIGLHAAYDWALLSLTGDPQMGMPSLFKIEVLVPHWLVGPPGEAGLADLISILILLAGVYAFIYRAALARASVASAAGLTEGAVR